MVYSKAIKHEKRYAQLVGASADVSLWKTRYASDMPYRTQAVISYYHSIRTKGILRSAGLNNHDNDQMSLIYIKN